MMEFGVEKFSQLAEMTGGAERRGEASSLVVTDFVSLGRGSSDCAGCARVLARIGMGTSCVCLFRDTSDTEQTQHLGKLAEHLWDLAGSEGSRNFRGFADLQSTLETDEL